MPASGGTLLTAVLGGHALARRGAAVVLACRDARQAPAPLTPPH